MIINMLEMEHVNGNEGPCINSVYFDQIIEIECAKINGNNLVDEKVTINWTGQKKNEPFSGEFHCWRTTTKQ